MCSVYSLIAIHDDVIVPHEKTLALFAFEENSKQNDAHKRKVFDGRLIYWRNFYAATAALGLGTGTWGLTVVPQYSSKSLLLAALTIVSPTCRIPLLAFSLDVIEASSRKAWARTMSFIAGVTCCNQGSG